MIAAYASSCFRGYEGSADAAHWSTDVVRMHADEFLKQCWLSAKEKASPVSKSHQCWALRMSIPLGMLQMEDQMQRCRQTFMIQWNLTHAEKFSWLIKWFWNCSCASELVKLSSSWGQNVEKLVELSWNRGQHVFLCVSCCVTRKSSSFLWISSIVQLTTTAWKCLFQIQCGQQMPMLSSIDVVNSQSLSCLLFFWVRPQKEPMTEFRLRNTNVPIKTLFL